MKYEIYVNYGNKGYIQHGSILKVIIEILKNPNAEIKIRKNLCQK